MANFYNLLHRDSNNWLKCKQALTAKNIDMANVPTDDFADKVRSIVAADGFEQTPELRQFPDIRSGLTDSTFKMVVLRGGSASIGIAVTLPAGQSGSINWGDGNTSALTASGAAVNYYHTWNAWQMSSDGLEEYNIVTISGNVTAIAAIASQVYAPVYWATVLWIAAKSNSLQSFAISTVNSASSFRPYMLKRCDFDTPNMEIQRFCFYGAYLRYLVFNGTFGSAAAANQDIFTYCMIHTMTYTNTAVNYIGNLFGLNRSHSITLTLNQTYSVYCAQLCYSASVLRYFKTNSAWGNFGSAFNYCYNLKEIDFSACPVNGITDATGWTNLYCCTKILFPSTGTGASRAPKAFASGMTSMGAIDITNSGLSRAALVDMFRSMPANATVRNCTITGSVGAADLTSEEIAIATSKNWVVIR